MAPAKEVTRQATIWLFASSCGWVRSQVGQRSGRSSRSGSSCCDTPSAALGRGRSAGLRATRAATTSDHACSPDSTQALAQPMTIATPSCCSSHDAGPTLLASVVLSPRQWEPSKPTTVTPVTWIPDGSCEKLPLRQTSRSPAAGALHQCAMPPLVLIQRQRRWSPGHELSPSTS
jgi:hypothetical protein